MSDPYVIKKERIRIRDLYNLEFGNPYYFRNHRNTYITRGYDKTIESLNGPIREDPERKI